MNIDPSGCWTISFNLNIDFEFFGIISFHASVGIVIDDDFGCKLFYRQSDNFDDETSCIGFGDTGISFTTQITNLDSVNELFEKDTMSVGGSVGNYISEIITDDITESSSPNIVGIGFGIGISPMPYSISIKKSKMYTHPGNYQGIGGLLREWLT